MLLLRLLCVCLGSMFLSMGACTRRLQEEKCSTEVRRVDFEGVKALDKGELREKIRVKKKSWKFWKKEKNCLEADMDLSVAIDEILAFYRDHGYHQTQASHVVKPYKGNAGLVDVLFKVQEGTPAKMTGLRFEGEADLLPAERIALAKEFNLPMGSPVSYLRAKEASERMQDWLLRRAYAFAKVDFALEINRDNNTLQVVFTLRPGKKTIFGKTIVKGVEHMSEASVAKYAAVPEGAPFHPYQINGASAKLSNSGVFSNLHVSANASKGNPSVADVSIDAVEGKPKEMLVGLGLGIEPLRTEVYLKALYTHRNFFGGLRTFRFGGQLGYAALPAFWSNDIKQQGINADLQAQFIQPDLFGLNSELLLGVHYNVGLDYAFKYHGPEVSVAMQKAFWWRRIQLGISYHFRYLDFFSTSDAIDNVLQYDPGTAGALFGYTDPYRLGYFRESFALDLRNRPVDPIRGIYLGVQLEHGGVYTGSAFDYQKIVPEFRGYLPIGKRVVLAGRMLFGQIFSQGNLGSPITQRLYLGGPNSHRGFSYNRLSYQICAGQPLDDATGRRPIGCALDSVGEYQRIPTGGDQMFLTQLELRVRLFELFKNWVSMAVFADGGDVMSSQLCMGSSCSADGKRLLDFSMLHWAVGAGVRYQTILGAIGFTVGVRLNRLDASENGIQNPDPGSRVAYHLSIGESF